MRSGVNLEVPVANNITQCIGFCDAYGPTCAGAVWVQSGQTEQYCYLKNDTTIYSAPSGLVLYAITREGQI